MCSVMKFRNIVFDDFSESAEDTGCWVEICQQCKKKYIDILKDRVDEDGGAIGTCSVKGCMNDGDFYVDFNNDEVIFDIA